MKQLTIIKANVLLLNIDYKILENEKYIEIQNKYFDIYFDKERKETFFDYYDERYNYLYLSDDFDINRLIRHLKQKTLV